MNEIKRKQKSSKSIAKTHVQWCESIRAGWTVDEIERQIEPVYLKKEEKIHNYDEWKHICGLIVIEIE